MPAAARIHDPVEHTAALAALLVGAAGGAMIAAAIVVTGGAAAPAIAVVAVAACAGTSMGGGLGELIGSLASFRTGVIVAPSEVGVIVDPQAGGVYINGRRAAHSTGPADDGGTVLWVGDLVECNGQPFIPASDHPRSEIVEGSAAVFVEGQPASRVGDRVSCGSRIAEGSPNVYIGGGQKLYSTSASEIPWYVEAALLGLGLAGGVGAIAMAGKGLRVIYACRFAGELAGGWGGGAVGGRIGGRYFGEGSKGQKLLSFGGGIIGGGLGAGLVGSQPIYGPVQRWAARNIFPGRQNGGTCGLQSCQQVIRAATGRNLSEKEMEEIGMLAGAYKPGGGTNPYRRKQILNAAGVPAHTERTSPKAIQSALDQRKGVVSSHDAGILWGDPTYKGSRHAVHTTGIVRDADGNVTHYIINDTGTGEIGRPVRARTYELSLTESPITVTDKPIW